MTANATPLHPQSLFPFLDFLRKRGFDLGVDQYLAVRDLILVLQTSESVPDSVDAVLRSIAPLLCGTPQQQAAIAALFREWLKGNPELLAYLGDAEEEVRPDQRIPDIGEPADPEKPKGNKRLWWLLTIPILLAGIWIFLPRSDVNDPGKVDRKGKRPRELSGWVESRDDSGKRLANARLSFLGLEAVTGSDGAFTLGIDPEGTERGGVLIIEHPDFPRQARYYLNLLEIDGPQTFYLESLPESDPAWVQVLRTVAAQINAIVDELEKPRAAGWRDLLSQWYWPLRLALWGVFCLIWIGLLYRNWNRIRGLRRESVLQNPEREPIKVAATRVNLFRGLEWRKAARDLRRHLNPPSQELDGEGTVLASAARGGLFTPVYGRKKVSPEYLVLADREGFDDHQARIAERLLSRLAESGNYLNIFNFRGSPQVLHRRGASCKSLSLQQAAATYSHCRLLLFSDGACCFSSFTGQLQHWFPMLQRWPHRVLMTPRTQAEWGIREKELEREGLVVLPNTARGFSRLSAIFHDAPDGKKSQPSPTWKQESLPSWLQRDTRRWTRPSPPPFHEQRQLLERVRLYLGEAGWVWLRACATFPVIHWELTLYLGLRLQWESRPVFGQTLLSRLSALPWFRSGSMPDWLRQRLTDDMSAAEKREVRACLDAWMSAPVRDREALSLAIARPQKSQGLSGFLRDRPAEEDANDAILLSFLEREAGVSLAMKLPPVVRRFLYRRGNPLLGGRLFPMLALMGVLVFALVRPYSLPMQESYIPRFQVLKAEEIQSGVPVNFFSAEGLDEVASTQSHYGASELDWNVYERQWQANAPPGRSATSSSLLADITDYLKVRGIPEIGNMLKAPLGGVQGPLYLDFRGSGEIAHQLQNLAATFNPAQVGSVVSFTVDLPFEFSNPFGVSMLPEKHSLTWDFGDGTQREIDSSQLSNPYNEATHSYTAAGTYLVSVELFRRFDRLNNPVHILVDREALTVVVNGGQVAGQVQTFREGGLEIEMVWCPPGTFLMGSPESEKERYDDDETQHEVTLTRGFWLARAEVTQAQWKALLGGANPSEFKGDDLPVESVSWEDVNRFIDELNQRAGGSKYRLPTEAEWEYACRAGSTTPFHTGENLTTDQANYNGNFSYVGLPKGKFRERTMAVKSFESNAWGLYDMHGNVWEWCSDWYRPQLGEKVTDPMGPPIGSHRAVRGGGWRSRASLCRSANRDYWPTEDLDSLVGFRLLRTP